MAPDVEGTAHPWAEVICGLSVAFGIIKNFQTELIVDPYLDRRAAANYGGRQCVKDHVGLLVMFVQCHA